MVLFQKSKQKTPQYSPSTEKTINLNNIHTDLPPGYILHFKLEFLHFGTVNPVNSA